MLIHTWAKFDQNQLNVSKVIAVTKSRTGGWADERKDNPRKHKHKGIKNITYH